MDWHLLISAIGAVGLPIAAWLLGQRSAARKILADKDNTIFRLREKRDSDDADYHMREVQALKDMSDGLRGSQERLGKAIYDLEIRISQQYATMIALSATEKRFFDGQHRLEEKLDRVLVGNHAK